MLWLCWSDLGRKGSVFFSTDWSRAGVGASQDSGDGGALELVLGRERSLFLTATNEVELLFLDLGLILTFI